MSERNKDVTTDQNKRKESVSLWGVIFAFRDRILINKMQHLTFDVDFSFVCLFVGWLLLFFFFALAPSERG